MAASCVHEAAAEGTRSLGAVRLAGTAAEAWERFLVEAVAHADSDSAKDQREEQTAEEEATGSERSIEPAAAGWEPVHRRHQDPAT